MIVVLLKVMGQAGLVGVSKAIGEGTTAADHAWKGDPMKSALPLAPTKIVPVVLMLIGLVPKIPIFPPSALKDAVPPEVDCRSGDNAPEFRIVVPETNVRVVAEVMVLPYRMACVEMLIPSAPVVLNGALF